MRSGGMETETTLETPPRRVRLWPAALGFWFVLGLLESTVAYARNHANGLRIGWLWTLFLNLPWWLLWVPLMPLAVALARRVPLTGPRWMRAAALHLGAALLFSSVHLLVEGVIYFHSVPKGTIASLPQLWRSFFGAYLLLDVVTYCVIAGGCTAADFYRRLRDAELQQTRLRLGLAEARMQALRAELHPHFFFNALNSVSGLVRRNENDAAVRMLARLGELLQVTLDHGREPEISLREELQLLERYLDIERVRFGDRLTIGVAHPETASDALVPTFILQPLVENAIRHGISRRKGPARIDIHAERQGDALFLAVRDTGAGLSANPREGIGLSNTRARLAELYGSSATLSLENGPEGGAQVRIKLPYHLVVGARAHA